MKNTSKRKPVNYVDNKRFLEEIIKYRADVALAKEKELDEPKIPEYIGECILKIAKNMATMPRFIRYSFKEEMISDGYENCIVYFHSFDPTKHNANTGRPYDNPFAYFSQVIYFAFLRRIGEEEEIRYAVYKNFQETITSQHDSSLLTDEEGNCVVTANLYDNINYFMNRFEKKKADKKLKRKQAKDGLATLFGEEETAIEESKDNE